MALNKTAPALMSLMKRTCSFWFGSTRSQIASIAEFKISKPITSTEAEKKRIQSRLVNLIHKPKSIPRKRKMNCNRVLFSFHTARYRPLRAGWNFFFISNWTSLTHGLKIGF
jgi:hypothetical protein